MKKIKFLVLGLLIALAIIPISCKADTKDKINVYIFRGEGCPHCEEAIEWFNDNLSTDKEYKEYYNLVQYEVWYDEDNSNLMSNVASALGTDASGVPFIVIGDEYFSGFSSKESPKKIKRAIKEAYNSDDYQDVVKAIKNGIKINKKEEKSSILPIIIVSAVSIVTVIALVFFTKEK